MSPIEIQAYSDFFQEQVIQLTLDIANEFNFSLTRLDQPDLLKIPKIYQSELGNFWIALDCKQVIGTLALFDMANNQGALKKVFVDKSYRGGEKSVAKALLETAMKWCIMHNISEIYLGTRTVFHAAHRFYEKNGFLEITKESLPKTFPINTVDSKFYKYQTQD